MKQIVRISGKDKEGKPVDITLDVKDDGAKNPLAAWLTIYWEKEKPGKVRAYTLRATPRGTLKLTEYK